jgi:PTH1 family peptidyl-tRNA hydrolase
MKYLIVGLGNIGSEYQDTRHNIGFTILDAFAKASNVFFSENRYGATCEVKIKGRTLILLKPSTFMNLSGNALRYWMQKENVLQENVLVVVDDIALPFGVLRLKPKGSAAGHNGLKNIEEILGHNNYARLRFGLGDDFKRGQQIAYVLGKWTSEQAKVLPERAEIACEMILSFCMAGLELTMTQFNKK